MDFKEAIEEVLVYEGRFSPEYSKNLSNLIMSESEKLGMEIPTYNLIWSIIHRETLTKKEYIMELYYRGGYINKAEKEIERILQVLKPKQ